MRSILCAIFKVTLCKINIFFMSYVASITILFRNYKHYKGYGSDKVSLQIPNNKI